LTASTEALSAAAFDTLDGHIRSLLRALLCEAGITREGAIDMFLAAAEGTLHTGDCAVQPYRARLTAMVDTLMAGLGCDAKYWPGSTGLFRICWCGRRKLIAPRTAHAR
jgi:hypothetical protein